MLVVIGLPGAGKTSVLNGAVKKKDMRIVNYGDIAIELAMQKGLVKDRDEIINIPVKEHIKIQDEVVARLEDTPKTILDTHAILRRSPAGYIAGLHPPLFGKVHIEGFVFIDARSEEIIKRSGSDVTRKRPAATLEQLDEDRLLSKILIGNYAAQTGAPFYFIINSENKLAEAVDEFIKIVERLGW